MSKIWVWLFWVVYSSDLLNPWKSFSFYCSVGGSSPLHFSIFILMIISDCSIKESTLRKFQVDLSKSFSRFFGLFLVNKNKPWKFYKNWLSKFIHSEKATKFWETSTNYLTGSKDFSTTVEIYITYSKTLASVGS